MFSVKDLEEPKWTKGPLTTEPLIDSTGIENATATLFAAAPELAGAVREYLAELEDRVAQAERLVRGARALPTHGRTPYSVVMARMAEADARRALAAASPLYAALAKAYGKTEKNGS